MIDSFKVFTCFLLATVCHSLIVYESSDHLISAEFIAQPLSINDAIQDHDQLAAADPSQATRSQGSWSHWWSYEDGISGPDYWSINKEWRLCSAGRKQSPVNIRTNRLVYDHLLEAIQLNWLEAAADTGRARQEDEAEERDALSSPAKERGASPAAPDVQTLKTRPRNDGAAVRVQLVNSGRGFEVWFERVARVGVSQQADSGTPINELSSPQQQGELHQQKQSKKRHRQQQQPQLILSRGPLSYSYSLFKIELHSTTTTTTNNDRQTFAGGANENNVNEGGGGDELELVPDALKSAKSSEHLIDGRTFDGELQLHFFNRQLASSGHEALRLADEQSQANLFATISVFLIAKQREQQQQQSAAEPLDFLLDNLVAIPNQDDSIELELDRWQVDQLITTTSEYITYQGSLNRPPCAESVDWILLNKAIRVESSKLANLFERSNTNQENVRPIKPLYSRLLRTTISSNLKVVNNNNNSPSCSSKTTSKQQQKQTSAAAANCTQVALDELEVDSEQRQQLNGLSLDQIRAAAAATTTATTGNSKLKQCANMKPNYVYQFSYAKNQFK